MVDTPFANASHHPTKNAVNITGSVNRSIGDWRGDVFNVKDFGATGNNSTNDQPAIQAAVNAATANGGGMVFFPAGNFRVDASIEFDSGSQAALRIVGSGGAMGSGQSAATNITTGNPIFIFHCKNTQGQGGNQPYSSVENICFINNYSPVRGSVQSTERSVNALTSISITNPAVFSKTAHGLVAGDKITLSSSAIPGGLSTSTLYYVIAAGLTADQFRVSLTSGGTAVAATSGVTTGHSFIAGGGFGGIYSNSGMGTRYESLGFFLPNGGIGIYEFGQSVIIESCSILGGYTGTNASDWIGIMIGQGTASGGRISAMGFNLIGVWGDTGQASVSFYNWDLEVSGCTICIGYSPIKFYDPYDPNNKEINAGMYPVKCGRVYHIGCESNHCEDGSTGAVIFLAGTITMQNVVMANIDHGNALHGVWLNGGTFDISEVTVLGSATNGYTGYGINIALTTAARFYACSSSAGPVGGQPWGLPTASTWNGVPAHGVTFQHCNTDGAVPVASLPTAITVGDQMLVNNSADAAYSGGVSNFGKTITGGGGNKVLARWNNSAWVIAG